MVVVAGAANASRVSSAVEVASVFVPALASEYGWSRTLIASATTLGGVATALSSPFVGRFLDRYGARAVVPVGALAVEIGCLWSRLGASDERPEGPGWNKPGGEGHPSGARGGA